MSRPRSPFGPFRTPAAVLWVVVVGCGGGLADAPTLRCAALEPSSDAPSSVTVADTLEVVVALDRRTEPLELLVRVDPLGDPGIVAFPDDAPPAAAAAGATVTSAAIFTVCLSSAPAVLVFEGADTPHDKVWVRVSTDRPVRAAVRLGGEGGVTLEPTLTVDPRASGKRRWTVPTGGT